MPKVVVCPECAGKGKKKATRPEGRHEEATIFLQCRSCKGIGWVISSEAGEISELTEGPINVKSELESIDSNSYLRDNVVPYIRLMIRLIDERFPADIKPKTTAGAKGKQPKSKKK